MRKVVIIGAGHVGSHCGYALAHSGIASEIVLVDVDKDKAHAQALDIADSVSFCERETVVRDGDYKDCEDAALVVVAIGEARKPGQTRLDMLCGLDRFVHQPGRLGLGAADLGLCGLFTVVVTNKIARSCGSDSNDQCHDHSDHGHCSSLSLTVKFCFNRQETLCGRTRARHQSNFQRKRGQQEQTQRKNFLCGRSGAAFRFTRCAYKNGQMKPH